MDLAALLEVAEGCREDYLGPKSGEQGARRRVDGKFFKMLLFGHV